MAPPLYQLPLKVLLLLVLLLASALVNTHTPLSWTTLFERVT